MGHHLGEIPHIDQRTADGTFAEMIGLGLYDGRQHRDRALFFDHLVANAAPSGSFSLNHSSASSGVANFVVGVDIDPNHCHWSRLSVRRLKFVKSFIKLARFLLYFEECVSSGSLLLLHLWCSRRWREGTLTSSLNPRHHCRR